MKLAIKVCNACQQAKLLADYARHPNNRDGLQNTCRACDSASATVRRHGMTRVEKAERAVAQGGCLICGTMRPGPHGWVVDHDHGCCGPVKSCARCQRGILCGDCNTALGMAHDDPARLRKMAAYLEAHKASVDRLSPLTQSPSSNGLDGRTDGTKKSLQVDVNLTASTHASSTSDSSMVERP